MGGTCVRGVEELDDDEQLPHPFGRCLRDAGHDAGSSFIASSSTPYEAHLDPSERPRTLLDTGRGMVEKHRAETREGSSVPSGYFESIRQQAETIAKQYVEVEDECEYTGGEAIGAKRNRARATTGAIPKPVSLLRAAPAELVCLHVYDLGTSSGARMLNKVLRPLGTGVFHCGIEIYGYEWSFSDTTTGKGDGVFCSKPKQCHGYAYSETVEMGHCNASVEAVVALIETMAEEWPVESYNLLHHNCGHFCNELSLRLGLGPLPDWVTNLAGVGAQAKSTVCCSSASATGSVVEEIPMVELLPSIPNLHASSNKSLRYSSDDFDITH